MKNITKTKLARCLTTFDLTALGIGSTLGAGIYVVAGQVAYQTAGPAVVISFLIAALASVLAGLCYAEFGARVPKTGSAYVYSYVTVGEFIAFIIGWNLILEYVIGTASVARAWSSYFDSLINDRIQDFFKDNMPIDIGGLSAYPDFFAFGITLLLTVVLTVGVKESSTFNNIFTGVNLLVVLYVVICGIFKADIHNWELKQDEVPSDAGSGGFLPFGFSGMMSGAATCFYAFVGFDCIATTGEECQNPQKAIPISIIISLLLIFLAYFGVSAVITLMCPYYLLSSEAPLPYVFDRVGWDVAKFVIAVGAICGLSTSCFGTVWETIIRIYADHAPASQFAGLVDDCHCMESNISDLQAWLLLGAMFPMPRVIYAMASDGLLFRFLARVSERFKTPAIATVISGFLAGIMAMMFDLKELVDMMSIGTLLAYTLVAVCVLILRYQTDETASFSRKNAEKLEPLPHITLKTIIMRAFIPEYNQPSRLSETLATWCIGLMCLTIVGFSAIVIFLEKELVNLDWWAVVLTTVFGAAILLFEVIIWRQPQNTSLITFKVPVLPLLPSISVFVNIYLMLKLTYMTWIRFGVWMFIGFLIYFGYGIFRSNERDGNRRNSISSGSESDDEEFKVTSSDRSPLLNSINSFHEN